MIINFSKCSCVCPDGDGIPDQWETNGVDINDDGIIDLVLSGADPEHKDIYVEIDYFDCSVPGGDCSGTDTHNHRPDDCVLNKVKNAFANAPISNPDGMPGINLHIIVDEGLPHLDSCKFGRKCYEILRMEHFGTLEERTSNLSDFIINIKQDIFYYSLWAHNDFGTSGIAYIGGSSSMVETCDNCYEENYTNFGIEFNGLDYKINRESAVLMHELGHNLGLRHGGNDNTNCKSNYISIMNYDFSVLGINTIIDTTNKVSHTGYIDFSHEALPSLYECCLNEEIGISSNFATVFGISNPTDSRRRYKYVPQESDCIDWDQNGICGNSVENSIDINYTPRCNDPTPNDILNGHDDWKLVSEFLSQKIQRPGQLSDLEVIIDTFDLKSEIQLLQALVDVTVNRNVEINNKLLCRKNDTLIFKVNLTNIDDYSLLPFSYHYNYDCFNFVSATITDPVNQSLIPAKVESGRVYFDNSWINNIDQDILNGATIEVRLAKTCDDNEGLVSTAKLSGFRIEDGFITNTIESHLHISEILDSTTNCLGISIICQIPFLDLCYPPEAEIEVCLSCDIYWQEIEIVSANNFFTNSTFEYENECLTFLPSEDDLFDILEINYCLTENPENCNKTYALITIDSLGCFVNHPPIAINDTVTIDSVKFLIEPLLNDFDLDGHPFSITFIGTPQNGTITNDIDTPIGPGINNILEYMPDSSFVGIDTLEYAICDIFDYCDTATIFINVPESVNGCKDTIYFCTEPLDPITICPQFCDFNQEEFYYIRAASTTYDCSLRILSDKCLKYTALPLFAGEETIQIIGQNNSNVMDTAYYIIQVTGCEINNDTLCNTTSYCTEIMTPIVICPEFCDLDSMDLEITNIASTFNCGLTNLPNNCIRYLPLPAFYGKELLTISGESTSGETDTVYAIIDVLDDCEGTEREGVVLNNDNILFNLSPVPTTDMLNIEFFTLFDNVELIIRDVTGREVETLSLNVDQEYNLIRHNVIDYPQGIYFITFKEFKAMKTIKFIKN